MKLYRASSSFECKVRQVNLTLALLIAARVSKSAVKVSRIGRCLRPTRPIVGRLLFQGWASFYGEWHRRLEPTEIRTLFWQVQQVAGLRRENRQLKQELERRSAEINALDVKADFYRRHVVLKSRFGMMLERTFS